MRVDMLSVMRGVDAFPKLWARRTTIALPDGTECDLLSLPDLVQAKKTQRDKDWLMIRRLLDAHFFQNRTKATAAQARFWLRDLRTPGLLIETARLHPRLCDALLPARPLLSLARTGDQVALAARLLAEEQRDRIRDQEYWRPLKAELESIRRALMRSS
ncbi:MAG: hypothetical protein NTY01_06390 [Verrucomicrobia bacterium]|nr:hypothetical protein [Verrucomicrobiota bacterium]